MRGGVWLRWLFSISGGGGDHKVGLAGCLSGHTQGEQAGETQERAEGEATVMSEK